MGDEILSIIIIWDLLVWAVDDNFAFLLVWLFLAFLPSTLLRYRIICEYFILTQKDYNEEKVHFKRSPPLKNDLMIYVIWIEMDFEYMEILAWCW